jgi:hypothetical protein
MNIWKFQRRLTAVLLGWAAASIAYGLMLRRGDDPFREGVGEQFAGWGLVNALIAIVGWSAAARGHARLDANLPAVQAAEKRKLGRILWVNTGLDVFYVLGGASAARTRGADDERWRGRGVGIMAQGGFLFFFDLVNALLAGRLATQDEP